MAAKQRHKCETMELRGSDSEGWTAICPHLMQAACGDGWPEAKANLRFLIKSLLEHSPPLAAGRRRSE